MTPTDPQLLKRICERDEVAFDALVARYREPLRRHLLGTVQDTSAAEDLLQEVWLRVWTRAEQWDGRGAVKPWLFRIGANLALNHLRSCKRRRELPLELPLHADDENEDSSAPDWMADTDALDPEQQAEWAMRQARLRAMVQTLPEEKRSVFQMAHEAEMDIREIAEALHIPEGTVKSRLYYARRALARRWEAFETEGDS